MTKQYRAIGSRWGDNSDVTYFNLMIKNNVLLVGTEYNLTKEYLYAIKDGMKIKAIAKVKENFKKYDSACPISKETLSNFKIDPDYVKYAMIEHICKLERCIETRDRQAHGNQIHTLDVINKMNKEWDNYLRLMNEMNKTRNELNSAQSKNSDWEKKNDGLTEQQFKKEDSTANNELKGQESQNAGSRSKTDFFDKLKKYGLPVAVIVGVFLKVLRKF